MTVEEYLDMDYEDLMCELVGENSYWSNVGNFLATYRWTDVNDLSEGQLNWLHKIRDSLEREKKKREV